MYKLIPQFLVIFSILTVIIIVLRRLPEVTIVEDEPDQIQPERGSAGKRGVLRKLGELANRAAALLLHYARAAKEHSIKVNYLERFSKALRLDAVKPRLKTRSSPGFVPESHTQASQFASADQTERQLIEKIQKNPSDKMTYEELGKLYLERRKFSDAEEVYEYLTRNYETEDSYFSRLGTVYFNLKKFEQAITAYSRAIELRADLPNRHVNLSLCFEALGDFDSAAEAAGKAVKIAPDNTVYLSLLADFLVRTGQTQKAQETLERLLELEPANESVRQRLMSLKF